MITSPRKAHLSAITVILALALSFGLLSCSDDNCETCPTCPGEKTENELYDGLLYVTQRFATEAGDRGVYVIDTKTEQVIDSIMFSSGPVDLDLTADGRYLAVTDEHAETRVYDTRTLTQVAYFEDQAWPKFMGHDDYLFLHDAQGGKARFYSVPGFQQVHEDTIQVTYSICYREARNSFFASFGDQSSATVGDHIFYEYSLDSFKVVRTWKLHDAQNRPYDLWSFDMSADAQVLYVLASRWYSIDDADPLVVTFDLDADSLIHEYYISTCTGRVLAHPTNGEVYVTDPGVPPAPQAGTIYVFDSQTGEPRFGIALRGFVPNSSDPLSARSMTLTPDGGQLYIATDGTHYKLGTVLRVDTYSDQIASIVFPEVDLWPSNLVAGPRPH